MDKHEKNSITYFLNRMMTIIVESTGNIADVVFSEYCNHKEHLNQKPIYNLFAEAFLSISSVAKLMFDKSWSQASVILRVAIEEVATLYVLSFCPETREAFVNLFDERGRFLKLSDDEKKKYKKDNNIKGSINEYFDYSWIKDYTKDHKYGRNQLLKLSHIDEFIVDIEELLNSFAHGTISIFQFFNDKEGWGLMSKYGQRITKINCKLYDFLCCSFKNYVGDGFYYLELNSYFKEFKELYIFMINTKMW